jgi:hypothetical protein
VRNIYSICNKHCDDTIDICQLMCATVPWGAHESFMHPIFVLKNGCDGPGGGRPSCLACGPSPPGGDLPESSRVFFFIVWSVSLYVNLTCGPPLVIS